MIKLCYSEYFFTIIVYDSLLKTSIERYNKYSLLEQINISIELITFVFTRNKSIIIKKKILYLIIFCVW